MFFIVSKEINYFIFTRPDISLHLICNKFNTITIKIWHYFITNITFSKYYILNLALSIRKSLRANIKKECTYITIENK